MFIKKTSRRFGLAKGNSDTYLEARRYYNSLPNSKKDPKLLFTIILYGFQQQIRFNSNHEFNNPSGNRWFNDKVLEKMISFSRRIKECSCEFSSCNFEELLSIVTDKSFVYLDPPYRFTCGSYNDGKRGFEGWTQEHETLLFSFLDSLDSMNVPFLLSYVLEHGGHTNENLKEWLDKRDNYQVIDVSRNQGRYANRKEVLILNYGQTAFCNKEQISEEKRAVFEYTHA